MKYTTDIKYRFDDIDIPEDIVSNIIIEPKLKEVKKIKETPIKKPKKNKNIENERKFKRSKLF